MRAHQTFSQIAFFRDLNYEKHRKVKIKKDRECYNSGQFIWAGAEMEVVKVYPSSHGLGYQGGIKVPTSFYKCGKCGECTH